ncbi:MAG: hypothetical protein EA417_09605 [Gammaproteobacteria bacterium]|nr:MAG: hypothetical protein EA417_09605 [Gammaproteobacteria bacterium]
MIGICVGVPLRDLQGTIIGSLDLSVPNEHVQLPTWGLMQTMARAIERQLAGAAPGHWPDEHPNQPLSAPRGILEFLLRDEAFGERKALRGRARTALDSAEHVLRNAMEETSRRSTEIEARQRLSEHSLNEFVVDGHLTRISHRCAKRGRGDAGKDKARDSSGAQAYFTVRRAPGPSATQDLPVCPRPQP